MEERMAVRRYVSIVDIVVVVVAAVAIFLPARPLEGVSAAKGADDMRFQLAAAEARVRARPDDGRSAEELSRTLLDAIEYDFAVEAPATAARARGMRPSPTRWRAQVAASKAYAELRDVRNALEWARDALASCHDVGDACPAWEEVRLNLYAQTLEAGIESGIDPKVDPDGFRRAGEKGLHMVHVSGNPLLTPPPAPPAPSP
jgi:hypothetical protein